MQEAGFQATNAFTGKDFALVIRYFFQSDLCMKHGKRQDITSGFLKYYLENLPSRKGYEVLNNQLKCQGIPMFSWFSEETNCRVSKRRNFEFIM